MDGRIRGLVEGLIDGGLRLMIGDGEAAPIHLMVLGREVVMGIKIEDIGVVVDGVGVVEERVHFGGGRGKCYRMAMLV